MTQPTDQEIVEVLAKACGKMQYFYKGDMKTPIPVDVQFLDFDPQHDLNHMAIVEAEIERLGLYESYMDTRDAFEQLAVFKGGSLPLDDVPSERQFRAMVDRQSASTRARAAYAVLTQGGK